MKRILVALAIFGMAATQALAQYPEKPIEIIVGFSAGGGTDVMARTVGKFLEKALGHSATVIVKNVPGAGGQIAFTQVATAKPDGYTLGTFNLPAAFALTMGRKADYGPDSFTYLANFVQDPNTIVVKADSGYNKLGDLLAAARANPGALTVGLSSLGGNDHFAALMLDKAAGTEFTPVPFKGAALVRSALLGGHVTVGTMALSQTIGYPNLKVLAVLDDKRSAFRPDVPTAKELGYDVVMSSMRGFVAPAGLDPEVRKGLVTALEQVNTDPEFQALMKTQGNPVVFLSGEDFAHTAASQADVAKSIWATTPWR